MALIAWDEVSWDAFVAGLEGYREHFPRAAEAPEPRAENAAEIIRILNRWACRLSTERAPGALDKWLGAHAAELEQVAPLTILDIRVPDHAEELGALHDDLIASMRGAGVLNMADAAASKALYLLQPHLFVMWDKEIRRSAPEGYGAYLLQMHRLALRLAEEAPTEDVEAYLQQHLGGETRKTLAKHLDEYNWFEAVGREQLAARRS
jgi:DNA-binding GntR family transcriptional regulator